MKRITDIHSAHRSGFTLVELLVVISIIAVLVSMLLPSMASARKAAQITICSSQLHQQGLGMNAYTVDYKNFYPQFGGPTGDIGAGRTGSTVTWGTFGYDSSVYNDFGNYIGLPRASNGTTAYTSTAKIKYCPTVKWTTYSSYTFINPGFTSYASGIPGYSYYTGRSMYLSTIFNFNTIKRRDNPKEILITDQVEQSSQDEDHTVNYGTRVSSVICWFNPHFDRSSQIRRSGSMNELTADGHVTSLDFSTSANTACLSAFYAYSWFVGQTVGPASSLDDGPYAVIR